MKAMMEKHYINRELSWLEFNGRVLEEAREVSNPILERLKFIAIFSNNLDEFFMVRVAGVRQQVESGSRSTDPAGMAAPEQLAKILRRVRQLVRRQYQLLNGKILPELADQGIEFTTPDALSLAQRKRLGTYFQREIMPVLTPVAVDPSHPFPMIRNGALEIAVSLSVPEQDGEQHAMVEVPGSFPRFISVDMGGRKKGRTYILLEDLVLAHIGDLFEGCDVRKSCFFRVTRDMDFSVDEEGVADLLSHLEKQLRRRRRRAPIRLELPSGAPAGLRRWLLKALGLDRDGVYSVGGLLNPAAFFELVDREARPGLLEDPWPAKAVPELVDEEDLFAAIQRERYVGLYHPFQSFDPVVKLLEDAAEDPDVLAIKQTLYRVSGDSPVVAALERAAENGKQVTVVVELKARFDEERNIQWARQLEEAGAHVIYGIVGLKVHSKALLIIRREDGLIRRYAHLSTGNYNDKTAKLYTDTGMLTVDEAICQDVAAMFNVLTGYARPPQWRAVAVAPFNLREQVLFLIDREARLSTEENPGHIVAKMNSLVDPEIIQHLVSAARKHVRIDLIVRGICCLRPGDTPNIRIISIVDRFLEHSRIYHFGNAGKPETYLASADWMPRNLDRRIELFFPVADKRMQRKLLEHMRLELEDTFKARVMRPDGTYRRPSRKNPSRRSQRRIYNAING